MKETLVEYTQCDRPLLDAGTIKLNVTILRAQKEIEIYVTKKKITMGSYKYY